MALALKRIVWQVLVGNLVLFVGDLKYIPSDDDILKWSLIAAGGVFVVVLAAVGVVCIYRKARPAGRIPNSHSAYLPQHLHRRSKVRYTGPGNGRDLPGTDFVLHHKTKAGRVRWENRRTRPKDGSYLRPVEHHEGTYPPGHVGHAITGYLSPASQVGSNRDPTRPGVYVPPSDLIA